MKKYDVRECPVVGNDRLARDVFSVTVRDAELALTVRPGQFAQISVPGKTLRRPISFCDADASAGTLRFVFQVRGEGTEILSRAEPGSIWNLLAPLGNGFDLGDTSRRALFVGGGIGVPPLLRAARAFGANASLLAGFRSRESIILKEDFERTGCKVLIATDDGSFGYRGLVTGLARGLSFDAVFACGPKPMLEAVGRLAESAGVPCQVSLEERMACGIGACLGCAVKLRGKNGTYYGHVCSDGPVFDASRVVWEG